MTINTQHFKDLLEKELKTIEDEITTLKPDGDRDRADETEVADDLEQAENDGAVLVQLEIQQKDVKDALQKIEDGTYGTCEVDGGEIEEERLEANPSARTCKAHMS